MLIAGIDAGTQSIKVVVYDSERKKVAGESSSPLDLRSGSDGSREQEASWWIDALDDCFSKLDASVRSGMGLISVSGQQHGFVPVGEDGSVLSSVKLWCDTSTKKECDELEAAYGGRDKLVEEIGNPILPGYTASKILHFRKAFPDLYSRMRYVLLPHDYLNYYLTGKAVMERGDASGTGLMNIYTSRWDERICSLISDDLVSKLPPISMNAEVIGNVDKKASEQFGIPESALVVSGGGDNMMSAIGTGSVSDGIVTMSLGTSGTLFATSSFPMVDRKGRLASFASSTGMYLPLLCTMNCTVASGIMRKEMGLDVDGFDKEAASAGIGAGGLVMLPFFNGERIPDYPHGKGVLAGMDTINVTRENIARATYEGVSYEFLLGIEAFRELGMDIKAITLTGGGSKSAFWRQLIADLTLCPVRVPKVGEADAFGAVLQALSVHEGRDIASVVSEHLEFDDSRSAVPDKDAHDKYIAAYGTWLGYCKALGPLFA